LKKSIDEKTYVIDKNGTNINSEIGTGKKYASSVMEEKKDEFNKRNDQKFSEGLPSRGRRPEGPPGPPIGEAPRKAQPGRREYGLASGRKILSGQWTVSGGWIYSPSRGSNSGMAVCKGQSQAIALLNVQPSPSI
jgi:hypothetical protein